jgi:hypothetical protein
VRPGPACRRLAPASAHQSYGLYKPVASPRNLAFALRFLERRGARGAPRRHSRRCSAWLPHVSPRFGGVGHWAGEQSAKVGTMSDAPTSSCPASRVGTCGYLHCPQPVPGFCESAKVRPGRHAPPPRGRTADVPAVPLASRARALGCPMWGETREYGREA